MDPYFYGDEAALAAGAVTASGRDAGAFWYNPAGLAGQRHGFITANASTFGARFRTIPEALRVSTTGESRSVDLRSRDVISVPNAVIGAIALSERVVLAGGLLTTRRDQRAALASNRFEPVTTPDGTVYTSFGQQIDLQSDVAGYHAGAALAVALSPDLRVGAALFGTYRKVTQGIQYALDFATGPAETDEHGFLTQDARVTATAFGGTASLGAQWRASSRLLLGLTVRAPELALVSTADGGASIALGSAGGTDPPVATLVKSPAPNLDSTGRVVAPARALAGLAIALDPERPNASVVEIGVDAAHGLPAGSTQDALRPVLNARAGIRHRLSPEWVLGAGVFSDRANQRRVADLVASDRVNYYGLTAGVSKRTPLALVKDPSPEALVLVTTVSLRFAAGFGEGRALAVDLTNPTSPQDVRSDVTFYEIMPYLGSTVAF